MRLCVLTWFVLGCVLQVVAQYNLVPNHSFEDNQGCPTAGAQIGLVDHWVNVMPSVDYHHECGTGGYGVPANIFGGGYAQSGQAYIGLAVCYSPAAIVYPNFTDSREFVGTYLLTSLISGREYYIEFYVRRCGSFCYATKNIGAHLSMEQPYSAVEYLFTLKPQVSYEGRDYIADSDNWTKISGTFVAQGGENFITIGNFDDDYDTDTLFVSCINHSTNHLFSAYFIDDVSVIPVDSLVGLREGQLSMGKEQLSIYPNPASKYLIMETASGIGTLRMMDMAGREVLCMPLHSPRQSINVTGIPAGVYVVVVEREGMVLGRRKVVVE